MLTSRRIIPLLAAAVLLSVMVAPASAKNPDARCYGVQGTGLTRGVAQTVFSGSATLRVGGMTVEDVVVTTTLLADGNTSHEFVFPDGSIIETADILILRPTEDPNVMSLRSRLEVTTGGTGGFHLLPSSTLTWAPPVAEFDIRGHVCFAEVDG